MVWLSVNRLKTINRVLPALVLIGIITTACTATRTTLWSWKMPGIGEEGTVQNVTKRSTYLDATLKVKEHEYRFLFPGGYRCTQVIKPGATIEYTSFGHIPAVRGSEGDCDPIGILSLKEWVNQHRSQMTPAQTMKVRAIFFTTGSRPETASTIRLKPRAARSGPTNVK